MLSSSSRGLSRFLATRSRSVIGSPSQVRSYHENIVEHYENPRNVGSLDKNDESVGTGLVGAPACGDVMKLQIKPRPAAEYRPWLTEVDPQVQKTQATRLKFAKTTRALRKQDTI